VVVIILQVRMITQEFSREVNRWTAEALVAIQEVFGDISLTCMPVLCFITFMLQQKPIPVFRSFTVHAFSV
jgi:hypothetical protein